MIWRNDSARYAGIKRQLRRHAQGNSDCGEKHGNRRGVCVCGTAEAIKQAKATDLPIETALELAENIVKEDDKRVGNADDQVSEREKARDAARKAYEKAKEIQKKRDELELKQKARKN